MQHLSVLGWPGGRGRGVPGVWGLVGLGGCYTGYYPAPSQVPIFHHILASGPTHGRMKAILKEMMRFLSKGPEWVQNGSRNDLRITLPDWSPDGPEMTLRSTSQPQIDPPVIRPSNMTVFNVLLTVADIKHVSSIDWIRPPT